MNLKALEYKFQKININAIMRRVFVDSFVRDFVIERNQEQLYYRGTDAKGNIIRTFRARGTNVYADKTISIKRGKGQPTDRVTLKDTGSFYKTFKVGIKPEYAEINANFEKKDGGIAANIDITNVLGLTKENLPLLIQFVKPYVLQEFKNALLKRNYKMHF
jgi:hypothetical protein